MNPGGTTRKSASHKERSHMTVSCGIMWDLSLWCRDSLAVKHELYSVQAQLLWCMDLAALWHVGSSWTRDPIHVPCIGRWILNHRTTREAPVIFFIKSVSHFIFTVYLMSPGYARDMRWKSRYVLVLRCTNPANAIRCDKCFVVVLIGRSCLTV